MRGASLSWLREAVALRVDDPPRAAQYFGFRRKTGHASVSHLVREKGELPGENTPTVVPGFIGAYPNALSRVRRTELAALGSAIAGLRSEADSRGLADRFAIRHTRAAFWPASDAMTDAYARRAPLEAALFDDNRLENR